jgi:drug/metabolite transporter (DMT)-like permease
MGSPFFLTVGSAIVGLLVLVAGYFGQRAWTEHRDRDPELPDADREYHERQVRRRLLGSTVMLAIALAMTLGLAINPRTGHAEARVWGLAWLAVFLLVCVLLVLAGLDWASIRVYALRHRRALVQERLEALLDERRRLAKGGEYPAKPLGNGPVDD